jgi:hypothetical protein
MANTGTDPPIFAVRRLTPDCWELVGPDEDPYRPPWRRWAVVSVSRISPTMQIRQRRDVLDGAPTWD